MTARQSGVSVVVPVHDGARTLAACLDALETERDGGPFEIIAVDDGSTDGSAAILAARATAGQVRVITGHHDGAAAAINLGVHAARHPFIAQVDQDVVVGAGWLAALAGSLDDPDVAAAQGVYEAAAGASLGARVMAWDLAQRYAAIGGRDTDHVCTGTTLYRRAALHAVGLFDESLGYGYDNDLSYRLRAAGHRLRICTTARSVHHWQPGLRGYLRQQYGYGYGRLDLIAKHPRRLTGDAVSPPGMIARVPLMALALATGGIAAAGALSGRSWPWLSIVSALLVAGLGIDRLLAAAGAVRTHRRVQALALAPYHLARDLAWVAATIVWGVRRAAGVDMRPVHSMWRGHDATLDPDTVPAIVPAGARVLAVLPAHNEALSLPAVIAELRTAQPHLALLVVDDGSSDDSETLLAGLGVSYLRFPERLGIGNAMRAGLRFAAGRGVECVVRVDADGQHDPRDVGVLATLALSGRADLVLGTRFPAGDVARPRARGLRRILSLWLALRTGRTISDPTCGLYAVGRRALRLLADHHPTGYPEPELRLFAHRNRLRVAEVPVQTRRRLAGRTSLTTVRMLGAAGRVALAWVIVPWRTRISRGH